VEHHNFNDQLPHGRLLRRWLNGIEEAVDGGSDVLAVMTQMLTGDPAQEASFGTITTRFGFASNADAKGAWDEINSAYSKVSGNGSVDSVNAALTQVIAKLR
jgi:hypothetical protein